ncbi:OLC1v1001402C1 [Oldenlandia corymbosa var. corymbosa]|uniref:OLC1v1001402C1 n=1 Tax=Oldenlandia corymbosa var. corymbosa TaxID=529605 RepID=A0AAV1D5G2_OLDCO|nr:OLC1v1001402C1 [Oldenlandia corymbosa var. corymbosa]
MILELMVSEIGFHLSGEKCFIWYGPHPTLIITDPKMIKGITFKHTIFRRPPLSPLDRFLIVGLFSKDGDEWAKRRKIINPTFNHEKLKNMVPSMFISCRELVKKWDKLIQGKKSIEIDVWPDFANLTADVISRTAFGSSFEEGRQIFELQKELFSLIYQSKQTIYINGSRFFPTKRNRRLKQVFCEADAIMRDLIKKREERMLKDEVNSEDLLGLLLESNQNEMKKNGNNKSFGLTTDDVIEEFKLLYLAGQETTSNLLVWTMVMLGIHRDWQEKAREEVFQVFGSNNELHELEAEGLNRLKILTMILNEVLRIFPPAINIRRSTQETTKIGDIIVPSGAGVLINLPLVHHHPELWVDDVKEFNPERFSQGIGNATKKPNSYFPFSMGPRICIGQNFALNEVKIAFVLILRNFSFEVSPSYEHAPFPRFTIQPRFGAKMILRKLIK